MQFQFVNSSSFLTGKFSWNISLTVCSLPLFMLLSSGPFILWILNAYSCSDIYKVLSEHFDLCLHFNLYLSHISDRYVPYCIFLPLPCFRFCIHFYHGFIFSFSFTSFLSSVSLCFSSFSHLTSHFSECCFFISCLLSENNCSITFFKNLRQNMYSEFSSALRYHFHGDYSSAFVFLLIFFFFFVIFHFFPYIFVGSFFIPCLWVRRIFPTLNIYL